MTKNLLMVFEMRKNLLMYFEMTKNLLMFFWNDKKPSHVFLKCQKNLLMFFEVTKNILMFLEMTKDLLMFFEIAKDLLMYCFQASDPDSLPPPVAFSPPNAPPISERKKSDNDGVWIRVDIKTCSWGGNIHIHNATVRTFGAQPLQIRDNCWKFWNIFIHMSTWKTLPMSLVKMDELSPCSTSLFHRMPSSKLEHFKMYTIGANVSLREKHVSYGTLQRFLKID